MTTIAWDGKTLASDTQITYGGLRSRLSKIFDLPDGSYVGIAGDCHTAISVVEWLRAGAKPEKRPEVDLDTISLLRVVGEGEAYDFFGWSWRPIIGPFAANGSGAHGALVAMDLGKTAVEAIELTAKWDIYTSTPVHTVEPVRLPKQKVRPKPKAKAKAKAKAALRPKARARGSR